MSSMSRCCDTGRPIVVDAGTGRTVCSCQLQRGVPSYLSRVPTLPETVYGTGNSVYTQANMLSAVYKMYGHQGQTDTVALTAGVPQQVMPMSAHAMAVHPYGLGYPGFDIHGARRKNATRETTSPLKAWLFTHKKNPYPTKAEKIMLAIVTRMTLTQVSTWFANARRRLKKENRLNGKDDDTFSDISGKDDRIDIDSSSEDLMFQGSDDVSNKSGNLSDISETSDTIEQSIRKDRLGKKCVQKLFSPDGRNELYLERLSSPELSDRETTSFIDQDKIPINDQALLSNNLNHLGDYESKVVTVNGYDIQKSNMTDNLQDCNKRNISLEKATEAAKPQQKPKIWSIAQMIA